MKKAVYIEYTVELLKSLPQLLFIFIAIIGPQPRVAVSSNGRCPFAEAKLLDFMVTSQLGLSSSSGFKKVVERLQWREDLSPRQVSGIV